MSESIANNSRRKVKKQICPQKMDERVTELINDKKVIFTQI